MDKEKEKRAIEHHPKYRDAYLRAFSKMVDKLKQTGGIGWKLSLNLSRSTKYITATLEAIIDTLADLTGQTSQTLTLGATNLAKISQPYLDMMTNKNWAYA